MQDAKVGIFEDNPTWQVLFTEAVERAGHAVVFVANTMDEAERAVLGLEDGDIDVALVDDRLSESSLGEDGAKIAQLLKEKFASVTVIGCSARGVVEGADYSIGKAGEPDLVIQNIIAEL